ncbi:hypothetical protein K1719_013444 [Acacia pycnantha]|nr:hypothetical protein K1719_013444 [Acacia pycnantha]
MLNFVEEIEKRFPNLFGQPFAMLVPSDYDLGLPDNKLNIGVVLSRDQAPSSHNVLSGIFDYLQQRPEGKHVIWFQGWSCWHHASISVQIH